MRKATIGTGLVLVSLAVTGCSASSNGSGNGDTSPNPDASSSGGASPSGSSSGGPSGGSSSGGPMGGGGDCDASSAVGGSAACASGGAGPADAGSSSDGASTVEDFVAAASDFDCLKNGEWTTVGVSRFKNQLGHTAAMLSVANSPDGGTYPVGTIIQLVPTEASVKRGAGFSAQSHDWEFFSLSAAATAKSRRATEIAVVFHTLFETAKLAGIA